MNSARDLGTKHVCWKCETRFYDLHKAVPMCPKCGTDQRENPSNKPARETRKAAGKAAAARIKAEPIEASEPLQDEVAADEPEDESDELTDDADDDT